MYSSLYTLWFIHQKHGWFAVYPVFYSPGEGCLVVQWKDEVNHTGILPLKFLRFHCYSQESVNELRETIRMRYSTDVRAVEYPFH